MTSLDNMKTRLEYRGGSAEGRLQKDKLESLKKALLYSYQAETAILHDKMFRCLLNTNKQKPDYDCKILSIPYEDVCLGEVNEGTLQLYPRPYGENKKILPTEIKPGDVLYWSETQTYWIVTLQFLEEDSYFRGEAYKCEPEPVKVNGKSYYVYIRGPVETTIQWREKDNKNINDLNYSLIMYITKDENTLEYFHRFAKVEIGGNMWEAQTVDSYAADGIIEVCLKEYYNNEYAETPVQTPTNPDESAIEQPFPRLEGPTSVHPFDIVEYKIVGFENGEWQISNKKKAKFIGGDSNVVKIEITTGTSGKFDLAYKMGDEVVILPIEIKSL